MPLYLADRPRTKISINNRGLGPSAVPGGTTITTGAVAHVATAWTEIFPAARVSDDLHELFIWPLGTFLSATITDALIDIGIGPAGSEVAIVQNLPAGWSGEDSVTLARMIRLPIYIPRGTRVVARARSLQTTKAILLQVAAKGYYERPDGCYTGIDVFGGTPASSIGTRVTSGNSGATGSWTSIGSLTTREYHGIMPLFQGCTSTSMTSVAYEYEIGFDNTVIAGSGRWRFSTASNEFTLGPFPNAFHEALIPPRKQLQIRGTCSGTSQNIDASLLAGYR